MTPRQVLAIVDWRRAEAFRCRRVGVEAPRRLVRSRRPARGHPRRARAPGSSRDGDSEPAHDLALRRAA
jgi:hypothetical protein